MLINHFLKNDTLWIYLFLNSEECSVENIHPLLEKFYSTHLVNKMDIIRLFIGRIAAQATISNTTNTVIGNILYRGEYDIVEFSSHDIAITKLHVLLIETVDKLFSKCAKESMLLHSATICIKFQLANTLPRTLFPRKNICPAHVLLEFMDVAVDYKNCVDIFLYIRNNYSNKLLQI